MQALRQRTAQAIAQTQRRQQLQAIKGAAVLRRQRVRKQRERNEIERKNSYLVRQEAWEKWNLGELRSADKFLSKQRLQYTPDIKMSIWEKRQRKRENFLQARMKRIDMTLSREKRDRKASPEYHVAKGDRIVIRATEGPCARYRGKIGTVIAVRRQQKVCVVEGMTIRQARAPKLAPLYTLFNEPSHDPDHHVLLPIPFSHMRLVKTVINGAGEKEDVILGRLLPRDLEHMGQKLTPEQLERAQNLKPGQVARQKAQAAQPTESMSDDERLAYEQASINTPAEKKNSPFEPKKEPGRITKLYNRITGKKMAEEPEELDETEDPTTPSDTPRIELDTPTWTPTLLRAPLPDTVIDELRGKYSKFRTRHDPEFTKRMQRIDSAKQSHERWVKSGAGLLDTPRKEAELRSQAQKREERLKSGGLNDAVLEGIGRVMWERGMRLTPKMEIEARKREAKAQGTSPRGPVASAVLAENMGENWKRELAEEEAR